MSKKLARRRVVTGHVAGNRSCVASDTILSGISAPNMPGSEISVIWGTDDIMRYPDNGAIPSAEAFFPPLHGTRMVELFLPANGEYVDGRSDNAKMADAAAHLEPGRPGMHRTETMDYIIVMEGRCVVALDDEKVILNTGDVLIQSGTIHAWFNPYGEPCRFIAVMVGAKNELCK